MTSIEVVQRWHDHIESDEFESAAELMAENIEVKTPLGEAKGKEDTIELLKSSKRHAVIWGHVEPGENDEQFVQRGVKRFAGIVAMKSTIETDQGLIVKVTVKPSLATPTKPNRLRRNPAVVAAAAETSEEQDSSEELEQETNRSIEVVQTWKDLVDSGNYHEAAPLMAPNVKVTNPIFTANGRDEWLEKIQSVKTQIEGIVWSPCEIGAHEKQVLHTGRKKFFTVVSAKTTFELDDNWQIGSITVRKMEERRAPMCYYNRKG